MKFFLPALLLLLSCPGLGQQPTDFVWSWTVSADSVRVQGSGPGGTRAIAIARAQLFPLARRALHIVDALEYDRFDVFERSIDTLSAWLLQPFAQEMTRSRRLLITLDSSLLFLPLEFLKVGSEPLALFRPAVYRINTRVALPASRLLLHRGFILRDTSADPENACGRLWRQYPESVIRAAHHIRSRSLRLPPRVDFVLMSTHGFTDSTTGSGQLFLNENEQIPAGFFRQRGLRLCYLDACQQGINRSIITTLSGQDLYYLAPIVSNDSGESSTRTITGFFRRLKSSGDPVVSIWRTRQELATHYGRSWPRLDVINKAFIFRIYRL